ncbi:thiamine phosphate synthase [Fodinibius sp.]|uniref:thiamine phosphate synthase n=1 Tax=Fodinibius sp. TaxID=1872440 RepID=UPI0035630066
MKQDLSGIYLITDTHIQHRFSHMALADQAQEAGVRLIQYRDKQATGREALADIEAMMSKLKDSQASFIVNDRADYALAGGADGVHLGQDDLPIAAARSLLGREKIIGGSSSTLEEALQVEQQGADYVAVGHIFETETKKKEYPPRGLETLQKVREAVTIPVVAIGGITLENATDVIGAGADMIAVSSAICTAEDPFQKAKEFVSLFV